MEKGNKVIFPEFDFLRKELRRYESSNLSSFPTEIRLIYTWQYSACRQILKAFYDEEGSPMDILERMIAKWDKYSCYNQCTSMMYSTKRDYALNIYDILLTTI